MSAAPAIEVRGLRKSFGIPIVHRETVRDHLLTGGGAIPKALLLKEEEALDRP